MPRKLPTILVLICLSITGLSKLDADDGHPIAIRQWSETGFTIETMQNMHVGIGLGESDLKRLPRPVDLQAKDVATKVRTTLRWSAETSAPVVISDDPHGEIVENDITVARNVWQTNDLTILTVDGVLISNLQAMDANEIAMLIESVERPEVLEKMPTKWSMVVIATADTFNADQLMKISDGLKPRMMIVSSSIDKIGDQKVEAISHNTVAVSAPSKIDTETKTRFVSLGDQPWAMTDELAGLFAKKEAACKASREMFAKLSVNQMNFKPDNGSHTPRWNSEHMMGRELLFFSQIFHAVDPSIPVMDLNPRQMPKDYTFAHADWSGAEEAAQTMRVETFSRRFGYLLDGMDLDKKAAGSKFWTPRKLLEQMERHYKQHSANVVKKMDLDGWPGK